jgi:zinc protease
MNRGFRLAPRRWLLAALVLVLLPVDAWTAPLGQRQVLPNGMVLLVSERRTVPIVTVTLLLQAGAFLDPPDKGGVANLTADLLMQGTATRSATQIKEAIEFVGGSLSVGAGQELTTVSLSVLTKDLDLGLDLLTDILLRPAFAPEEIQRKRAQVLAGIRRKHEDPGDVGAEAFDAAIFGSHPYGRPAEGDESTVPRIAREDLVAFHDTYYRPNRAILAVVGDVETSDLQRRLAARLGSWTPGGPPVAGPPAVTAIAKAGLTTIPRDVTQASIFLGHLGIRRESPDFYAVLVMNYILGGGGFGSRLMSKIREEKGWAYDVRSGIIADKYAGAFLISLQTKNQTAQEAIQAALAEVRRIREQPVSAQELSDARAFLTGSFPLRLDTNGKLSRLLANVEFYGLGLDYPDRYPDLINHVTAADVQRVAQKYLDPETYALVIVADLARAKLKE